MAIMVMNKPKERRGRAEDRVRTHSRPFFEQELPVLDLGHDTVSRLER